jgi:hypothetical protein
MEAWFFSKQDTRLGYGDNRLIAVGETHFVQGPLIPNKNGLYASVRIIDTLLRAPLHMEHNIQAERCIGLKWRGKLLSINLISVLQSALILQRLK